ncbi:MAG: HIT family protein [Deltaproteobacteria bacterium]|nr:HIT family protein [Deltaproteobacteria bacterium]
MPSIFTHIIEGRLPGHFVWKDAVCVAFLTIAPLKPGHTLVVPRQEVEAWTDLEPDALQHLTRVAQSIARALDRIYRPEKVGLTILGLEVPHVHLHVSCIWSPNDLDFGRADSKASQASLAEAAGKLRAALRELGHPEVADA